MSSVERGNRVVAAVIDFAIAGIASVCLALTLGVIGVFLSGIGSALYIGLRDGAPGGSPGKRLLGLRVVGPGGRPITYGDSLRRNLVFALPIVIGSIPVFAALEMILLIAAVVVELVLILTREDGRRFGDQWAGTRVVPVAGASSDALAGQRFCSSCGALLGPEHTFCGACGARVGVFGAALTCPACGTPARPGMRFCIRCGATLAPTGQEGGSP
jgi:uncharacterized RDD family membrane protein YckC